MNEITESKQAVIGCFKDDAAGTVFAVSVSTILRSIHKTEEKTDMDWVCDVYRGIWVSFILAREQVRWAQPTLRSL